MAEFRCPPMTILRCPLYRPFSKVSWLMTQLMTAYVSECFTMNEVNRLRILQGVIDGRLTASLASQRSGLTDRHCQRLLAHYRESGPLALANRRKDRLAEVDQGAIVENGRVWSVLLTATTSRK